MKKSFYIKPELDTIVLNEDLLDTLPKDSKSYEDDILAKPNSWFEDEESSDIKQQNFQGVWGDD